MFTRCDLDFVTIALSIMNRKQNIFLFFDERDSEDLDLKLVRLYTNTFIIDEDEQSEIAAVIPLIKHVFDNTDEKEASDEDAVFGQLEKLGYDYFNGQSYVTHFIILTGFTLSNSIHLWIDYWFNELILKHQDATVDYNYRFVCTSLQGSQEKICTKEEAKVAYQDFHRRWDSINSPLKLGSNPISINADNSMPVDIEVEQFKQAITAQILPVPLQRWLNNFHEIHDNKDFFFYQALTDSKVRKMNKDDLDKCRDLRLKPELDTIFRRLSGQRFTYIIFPKPARCKKCSCKCEECLKCKCKKRSDLRVEWLNCHGEPIAKPGRMGTTIYLCEEDTCPVIMKGDYQIDYYYL